MYQAVAYVIDNLIFTRKEGNKTVNVYLDSLENEIYCFSISENSTYDEFKNHCLAKIEEIKSEI